MQKMTHGEIRGLLVLAGLMMLVVIHAWFSRLKEEQWMESAAVHGADSVLMKEAVREAMLRDSVRQGNRLKVMEKGDDTAPSERVGTPGDENLSDKNDASEKESSSDRRRHKQRKASRPASVPAKSPLDRPM